MYGGLKKKKSTYRGRLSSDVKFIFAVWFDFMYDIRKFGKYGRNACWILSNEMFFFF